MQNLGVISINFWSVLISLLNLTVIFLIVKKFLFKPIMKVINDRQSFIDSQYANASKAEEAAKQHETELSERLAGAKEEAAEIIKSATESARSHGDGIIAEAKAKAEGIISNAEADAELARKKAEDGIRDEIVDVAAALSEKVLSRKISEEDHRSLIDSVIDGLGDGK